MIHRRRDPTLKGQYMTTPVKTETVAQMIRRLSPTTIGPDDLSKAILREIGHDADRMYAALQEALPGYCRVRLSLGRRRIEPFPADVIEPEPVPTDQPSDSPWVSKRDQRINEWFTRAMAEQFHTERGYRPLGQLTVADLEFAAQERRNMASRNLAEALRMEEFASALRRYSVTTVGELPPAVVGDILQRAA